MKRIQLILMIFYGIAQFSLHAQDLSQGMYLANGSDKKLVSKVSKSHFDDYVQSRYPKISQEKRQDTIEGYSIADKKSGLFIGVSVGYGRLMNNYLDGRYNQTATTIDELKSQRTGVFKSSLETISEFLIFGGRIGYQSFFNPYFGSRIYGDASLGNGKIKNKANGSEIGSALYMLGAVNVDVLLEAPLSSSNKYFIGGYAGLGIGTMLLLDSANEDNMRSLLHEGYKSRSVLWDTLLQVDYTFNVGISLTIATNNRIEIGTKIPWNFLRLGLEKPSTYEKFKEESKTLVSKDIEFKRSIIWTLNYVYLF